jgi:hypothetical protein
VNAILETKDSELYKIWWMYYYDCLDLLNSLGKHPAAMFGNDVWPNRTTQSISSTVKFWDSVNLANINDLIQKEKGRDVDTVKDIFSNRPKHFNPGYSGSEQLLDSIMDWDYSSPYFQVDGNKIS